MKVLTLTIKPSCHYLPDGQGKIFGAVSDLIHVEKTTNLSLLAAIDTVFRGKNQEMKKMRFVGLDAFNTMSCEQKGKLFVIIKF